MKKCILSIVFILLYPLLANSSLSSSISYQIKRIAPNASVGVMVENAATGKVIYAHNAYHYYMPASCTKLFTAAAALYNLGNKFYFETLVGLNPKELKNSYLHGNLYIKFTGDPTLTSTELKTLIRTLKARTHIKKIIGDIILDTSTYGTPVYPQGIMRDDLNYCYGAPATAIILNQNCLHLGLYANSSKTATILRKSSDATGFVMQDNTRLVDSNALKTCQFEISSNSQNQYHFAGCLPKRKVWWFALAIKHPGAFASRILQEDLYNQGITLTGNVETGTMPEGLKIIASHDSKSLASLINTMLVYSNNLYAETLTKTLGKYYYGVGNYPAGLNAIKAILKPHVNYNLDSIVLEDGAGDSRYNLVTPHSLVSLLYGVYHSSIATTFIKSLPAASINGTLRARMYKKGLIRNVRAKTGSMKGVSSLTGYVTNRYGHKLIFSILMNGIAGSLSQARALQDSIVWKIYNG